MAYSGYSKVVLEDAWTELEYTGCYSMTTQYHLNYFVNGMFSMPGGIPGLFNFFEYDEDLKYDPVQMQRDIQELEKKNKEEGADKLYLILWYIDTDSDSEQQQLFEFKTGRQETYDYIKEMLKDEEFGKHVDVMKSRILADSKGIRISHKVSIYKFMFDMKYGDKVEDNDSSFDIEDWKYDFEE